MEFITNFIDWIVNIVTSVYDFLVNIIDNTILMVKYIGVASTMAFNLITSLPVWLQAFGTITITISIVYLIVGRSSGKSKGD